MTKNKVAANIEYKDDLISPLDQAVYSKEKPHALSHKLQLPSIEDRKPSGGFITPISDNDKYSIKLSLESNDENAVLMYDHA